ncbi:hypothetical protein PGT21_009164 [Puccinia graminis f. sp. tritici]|uniref:Uncharacterized protein n=1 Tax=Puccinia graminis f. sp. tritici TaxID=56615 RepID=A0A5B0PBF2_PUCGR|nr:hypothetical protein PGT21_009164 [Puccinia graminis f. sp. tritici]KAA1098631.1 hypothetical protein PGTUg99_005019 [Puccinia graminis f. sp. tritici]
MLLTVRLWKISLLFFLAIEYRLCSLLPKWNPSGEADSPPLWEALRNQFPGIFSPETDSSIHPAGFSNRGPGDRRGIQLGLNDFPGGSSRATKSTPTETPGGANDPSNHLFAGWNDHFPATGGTPSSNPLLMNMLDGTHTSHKGYPAHSGNEPIPLFDDWFFRAMDPLQTFRSIEEVSNAGPSFPSARLPNVIAASEGVSQKALTQTPRRASTKRTAGVRLDVTKGPMAKKPKLKTFESLRLTRSQIQEELVRELRQSLKEADAIHLETHSALVSNEQRNIFPIEAADLKQLVSYYIYRSRYNEGFTITKITTKDDDENEARNAIKHFRSSIQAQLQSYVDEVDIPWFQPYMAMESCPTNPIIASYSARVMKDFSQSIKDLSEKRGNSKYHSVTLTSRVVSALPFYLFYVDMINTLVPLQGRSDQAGLRSQRITAGNQLIGIADRLLSATETDLKMGLGLDKTVILAFQNSVNSNDRYARFIWKMIGYWINSSRRDLAEAASPQFKRMDNLAVNLRFKAFFNDIFISFVLGHLPPK